MSPNGAGFQNEVEARDHSNKSHGESEASDSSKPDRSAARPSSECSWMSAQPLSSCNWPRELRSKAGEVGAEPFRKRSEAPPYSVLWPHEAPRATEESQA